MIPTSNVPNVENSFVLKKKKKNKKFFLALVVDLRVGVCGFCDSSCSPCGTGCL